MTKRLPVATILLLGLIAAPGMVGGSTAQERVDDADQDRGPRFLLASADRGPPVPADTRRSPTLKRRISVSFDGVSLKQALDEISRRANLRIMYSPSLVPLGSRVYLKAENITVAGALSEILMDVAVDVLLSPGGQAALVRRAAPPAPVTGAVSGRVLDAATGQDLQHAEVSVEGTSWRALTDARGRYRIAEVPAGKYTVTARRIGYQKTSRPVTVTEQSDATIDFALSPSALNLDEVVVTGTPGEAQRRSLGNSIVTIDAVDAVSRSGVSDLTRLLNGRAAGIVVTPGTGRVGSGPQINIRGRSTLSLNNQPLVYIDGVRVVNDIGTGPRSAGGSTISRLDDISPADIQSIEIIKGPAAATIYGTEAANGVIQIVTKKSNSNQRPQVTATLRQGTTWFSNADGRIPSNFALDPGTGQLLEWDGVAQEDARGTPIWGHGQLQGYGLAVSGASSAVRYYFSTNYDRDRGIEPTNRLRRFSGHANVSAAINEKLDLASSINVVSGTIDQGQDRGTSVMFSTLYGSPLTAAGPRRGFFFAPPEAYYSGVFRNTQAIGRFTGSLQVNHRPSKWFNHRLTVGLDQTGEDNQALTEFMPPEVAQFFTPTVARGSLLEDRRDITYATVDYGGTVTIPLASNLTSSSSVGGQYYRRRTNLVQVTGQQFPAPGLKTAAAAAVVTGSQDYVTNATAGVYVQEQLAWHNRRYLTAGLRVDNNSAFGEAFDLAVYPKISAAWTVSEEQFWHVGWINQLRIRSAFGASGQQPQDFAALRSYRPTTGTNDGPVVTPQFVGNPDLKPERGDEIELGLETSLFDRIGIEFTYYSRRTRDAILLRNLAPSTGFPGQQFVNVGKVSNHGIELQMTAEALRSSAVGLDFALNLATSDDKIEDLGGLAPISLAFSSSQRHQVGYPVGAWFAKRVVSAELNANGRAINIMCDAGPEHPGTVLPCAQAPQLYLGRMTPKLTGAGTVTLLLFQRFRFYGMVDFKTGYRGFDFDTINRCAILNLCEISVAPQRFDPVSVAVAQNATVLGLVRDYVSDASFAKLRELSITYTPPEKWTRLIGAHSASITIAGRNLHTWSHFIGLDPESRDLVGTVATGGAGTVANQAQTPQLAQFVTMLTITF